MSNGKYVIFGAAPDGYKRPVSLFHDIVYVQTFRFTVGTAVAGCPRADLAGLYASSVVRSSLQVWVGTLPVMRPLTDG